MAVAVNHLSHITCITINSTAVRLEGIRKEGALGTGGCLARLTNGKKENQIDDHGYKSFVFPNHENKQVRYSF